MRVARQAAASESSQRAATQVSENTTSASRASLSRPTTEEHDPEVLPGDAGGGRRPEDRRTASAPFVRTSVARADGLDECTDRAGQRPRQARPPCQVAHGEPADSLAEDPCADQQADDLREAEGDPDRDRERRVARADQLLVRGVHQPDGAPA